MVTLSIVIPLLNHKEETIKNLQTFIDTADNFSLVNVIIIDNGSDIPASEWGFPQGTTFIRHNENIGVLPALQEGYMTAKNKGANHIAFFHNDVQMHENGWDTKLIRILDDPTIGCAGFFGAKGLGTTGLYRDPYVMSQFIRHDNVSGCIRMPSGHNFRTPYGETEDVAVLDGFSLICSVAMLDKIGGFDLNLPPHHMYDNDTCVASHYADFRNVVIAMDAYHTGGMTDVTEDWNKPFGKTKQEIHADAHYPYFYNKWRGRLPIYVR